MRSNATWLFWGVSGLGPAQGAGPGCRKIGGIGVGGRGRPPIQAVPHRGGGAIASHVLPVLVATISSLFLHHGLDPPPLAFGTDYRAG